ncbi:MAG: hypothetical protein K0Q90_2638 [Paenibacillaceae bacterium]|nr:hypothetical protein [Paenibacillaceae bacterium]
MNVTHPHYTNQWINDHLDLYNYAGEYGPSDYLRMEGKDKG